MPSPTAEALFRKRADLDARSGAPAREARARVHAKMLDWAEIMFIMDEQRDAQQQQRVPRHPELDRMICLDIPDRFTFLQRN